MHNENDHNDGSGKFSKATESSLTAINQAVSKAKQQVAEQAVLEQSQRYQETSQTNDPQPNQPPESTPIP